MGKTVAPLVAFFCNYGLERLTRVSHCYNVALAKIQSDLCLYIKTELTHMKGEVAGSIPALGSS
jgi:hypothetical protein